MVDKGEFREDLYYRLRENTPIYLPLLRERQEDIPLLAEHFLKISQDELGKQIRGISEEAMELIQNYEFPGNVRELQNLIKHSVGKAQTNVILPADLPPEILGCESVAPKVNPEESENKDKIFDLTVPVFCKFISVHGAGIDYGQLIQWLDEVLPPEKQAKVDAAKREIGTWEGKGDEVLRDLKDIVKSAIERLVEMKGAQLGAQPIDITGKTLDEIRAEIVHQFIGEYGDEHTAAKALDIELNVVEEMANRAKPKVRKIEPLKLDPIPEHEIERLLSESIKNFLGEAISDRKLRERGRERFSKTEDERLRILKLALLPLPYLLEGESGAGYICFGGMTFIEIEYEVYRRATYLYSTKKQAAETLGVSRNTAGAHMPKNSPKNYTLFG